MINNHPSFCKPPFDQFVHPDICFNLALCGLTRRTHFDWYVKSKVADLVTFLWDADGYYYNAQMKLINEVNKPEIIPAYSLMMVMELIPGPFSFIRDEQNNYELAIDNIWQTVPETGKRMPDVFGNMVLQLFRRRILTAEDCNHKINALIN